MTGSTTAARRVARAAGLVMALFVLSRLTGLARQVIVGAYFGTSPDYDAYVAAFRLPDMLFQLVAGGALVSALLPTYTTLRAREGAARGWALVSGVMTLVLVVLTVGAVLLALTADILVRHLLVPEFSSAQQALTASLLRVLLIGTVIFGLSGVAMSVLNAHQHFFLPALAPSLYNLGIVGGAVFLSPRWGVHGLAWGVVGGAALHFGVQVPGLWRVGWRYRPRWAWRDPGVRHVLALMGPRVLGLAAVQVNFLVNTMLASGLPPGRLSALDYAFRLMLMPLGIFAQAVATAAFPTFAEQAARGERRDLQHTVRRLLQGVTFLTLPATVGLVLLAQPLVAALFQRQAFTATSTALTATALQAYAVGLCGHALVEVLARAFYALHDTRTPVAIGVAAMALNIALNFWWVRVWGHVGLALANSVATLVEAMALVVTLRQVLGGLDLRAWITALRAQALAGVGMGVGIWGVGRVLAGGSPWLVLVPAAIVGGILYVALAYALGLEEARHTAAYLKQRLKPRASTTPPAP